MQIFSLVLVTDGRFWFYYMNMFFLCKNTHNLRNKYIQIIYKIFMRYDKNNYLIFFRITSILKAGLIELGILREIANVNLAQFPSPDGSGILFLAFFARKRYSGQQD